MKIRVDFVTNSSSNSYIVTNISDTTKNMLDLLREAAQDDFGPWQAMPECYLPLSWEDYQTEEDSEEYPCDRNSDHHNNPVFLEQVAQVMSFPPGHKVKVTFEWANLEGMILLMELTESFEIESIPM